MSKAATDRGNLGVFQWVLSSGYSACMMTYTNPAGGGCLGMRFGGRGPTAVPGTRLRAPGLSSTGVRAFSSERSQATTHERLKKCSKAAQTG